VKNCDLHGERVGELFGQSFVRKSGIAPIVTPTVAITGPTIDPITNDGWPYYYRPHYYDPGWSRGFNALNSCCNASLPNPS
jgi:hypothetical protein